ncbi:hypothetical protein ABZ606_26560 [Streptomyces sp. NPDC012461]|jgi:hypothetical protein|uniref:Uncharacterized protein n=2 Tax=unclassified Streptomyces TaxID=2593676 RepID=A0A6G3R4F5_9ACTN|nr:MULTISPECIES: hypothetical protein [unclassified Streptomyces]MBM7089932.1 hypothetical protein [Streptomyces sp. S12]NEA90629.1 hypothetical protein [Streptomyces sp. SID14436]NEC81782.1 hypothetical protein [Streptomyces sp. SID7958]NED23001.1 hypothetical protein [Streptomyces sp. SID9913]
MVELGILFGLLGVAALGLVVVLLRRQNGRTENADGLRIERARLVRARNGRVIHGSGAVRPRSPRVWPSPSLSRPVRSP